MRLKTGKSTYTPSLGSQTIAYLRTPCLKEYFRTYSPHRMAFQSVWVAANVMDGAGQARVRRRNKLTAVHTEEGFIKGAITEADELGREFVAKSRIAQMPATVSRASGHIVNQHESGKPVKSFARCGFFPGKSWRGACRYSEKALSSNSLFNPGGVGT